MTMYTAESDGATETIDAETYEDACAQARAWMRDGSWGDIDKTLWVHVRLSADHESIQPGEYCECCGDPDQAECDGVRLRVRIDPAEPPCTQVEHDWQRPHALLGGLVENPGVQGHGGGVTIDEVCMHCGCKLTTDTWAQDRETGEQGLESVAYAPRAYEDEVAALAAGEEV